MTSSWHSLAVVPDEDVEDLTRREEGVSFLQTNRRTLGKICKWLNGAWRVYGNHCATIRVHYCLLEIRPIKAQVTLCRSFFADVPDHRRPPRSVMIVTKPSNRGLNSRSLSVQDCLYDLSTTAVRHWYDGSVWSALSTFSTTISTTTDTIDTTALTMLTTTPTLLPICYHD